MVFFRFQNHQKASENQSFKCLSLLSLSPENFADLQNNQNVEPTVDNVKYSWSSSTGTGPDYRAVLKAIWDGKSFKREHRGKEGEPGEVVALILDRTNFYHECGGQVADFGLIEGVPDNSTEG